MKLIKEWKWSNLSLILRLTDCPDNLRGHVAVLFHFFCFQSSFKCDQNNLSFLVFACWSILWSVPPHMYTHRSLARWLNCPWLVMTFLFAWLTGIPAPVKILKCPDKRRRQQRGPASALLFLFTWLPAVLLLPVVRNSCKMFTKRTSPQ